jgi:hypothetical protein
MATSQDIWRGTLGRNFRRTVCSGPRVNMPVSA